MKLTRNVAAIAAALALTASSAQAQLIKFATTGAFTGTGCEIINGEGFTSCIDDGGVTLRYTFGEEQVLDTFGNAQFGSFSTTGVGPSTFSDVLFTLTINQTSPTNESAFADAAITGTVSAIQGGLSWSPLTMEERRFSLGDVNYTLSVDAETFGVRIDPPGEGGMTSSPQTIRGFVTTTPATVPEPGTYALMVAGLAGLAVTARRRNRTA